MVPLLIAMLITCASYAQRADTTKKQNVEKGEFDIESVPEYPGGLPAFYAYVHKNLKYPDVARLIGINGKLHVSFVVDKDGSITDVTPTNCIGAGCEAEAVKLLEGSPKWKPGIQNSKAVRVRYNMPITFNLTGKEKVYMINLRKSDYGFIFNIKGTLYTIDEAEKILGKQFESTNIEIAQPFFNYNKIAKFDIPNKKEVYLIILKST